MPNEQVLASGKYLKSKLKKENSELISATTQLKLKAADGKRYK